MSDDVFSYKRIKNTYISGKTEESVRCKKCLVNSYFLTNKRGCYHQLVCLFLHQRKGQSKFIFIDDHHHYNSQNILYCILSVDIPCLEPNTLVVLTFFTISHCLVYFTVSTTSERIYYDFYISLNRSIHHLSEYLT